MITANGRWGRFESQDGKVGVTLFIENDENKAEVTIEGEDRKSLGKIDEGRTLSEETGIFAEHLIEYYEANGLEALKADLESNT